MKWYIGYRERGKENDTTEIVENRTYNTKKECSAECEALNQCGGGWDEYEHFPVRGDEVITYSVKKKEHYRIKSVSEDGTYYLVNGWSKNKAFWIKETDSQNLCKCCFNKLSQAKASLTKLLKVMPEYRMDKFYWEVV